MLNNSIPFIDLKSQYARIKQDVDARIAAVLDHGQYIMGPEIGALEQALADYVGVRHCIGASSGTDTLLMAMMACDIGAGDEVITSPFTFIATGEMIALLGARPVFVDVDPRTYNIDPAQVEAAITPRPKAIMPVSLYGQCAEMDAINAIGDKHGLVVIEDAAQSFGATYKGRKSCALSKIGSTSFFPSKPLGAYGDGGALFTDDDHLAKLMREIRVHGQDRHYHHPRLGINGRLDAIQAAVVLAKLSIFPSEVEARQRIARAYNERLDGKAVTPFVEEHNLSVYAQYTLLVSDRDRVQQTLREKGIPTAVHYPVPLNLQPVFADLGQPAGSFPVAEDLAKRVISLPMSPYLTDDQIDRICSAVLEAL
jgi:UDP-2-acetamido-2-deoxy-ribo-hexuluronate aminotransferase